MGSIENGYRVERTRPELRDRIEDVAKILKSIP
jgi:hypothetical protein